MDVRCSRCGTEYDFDDALVSERGTTVKCTNCGYQFKVFPGGAGGAPERWIVRKSSGRELVYTSLRDLQRAIAQRQVGPHDMLSRGGGQPLRALGAIAELEPFFLAQGPVAPPKAAAPDAQRTLLGMSPGGQPRTEDTVREAPAFAETAMAPTQHSAGATPMGGIVAPRRPEPAARPAPYPRPEDIEPKTLPRNQQPEGPTMPEAQIDRTMQSGSAAAATVQSQVNDGMTAAFRNYQDSFSDQPLPGIPGAPRRSALRWVVALVLIGAVAFVAGTIGVPYLKRLGAAPPPPALPPKDDRVKNFLAESEAALSRGDYEGAKEQLDKASALAETDPSVLCATARLEAIRADASWLSLKLLDASNTAEVAAEKLELERRVARVRKAADSARGASPNDENARRAAIDALRLSGDLAAARAQVASLSDISAQPETAYVLAALDMAEASPSWSTVIDRLRTAASAERGIGRGRAALVYALATSGASDEAKSELAKLQASGSTPLVARLSAYVLRVAGAPAGSASAAPPLSSATSLSQLPVEPTATAAPAPAPVAAAGGGEAVPKGMDFRKLLEDASAAKRSGDLGRAEALYHAAEEQSPGNIEAIGGLGDVARARGDSAAAARYYDQVLQQNPTYLPTLIAAADMKWASGDRPGALALYKRVANQADPGSSYGQRAAQRIAEAQSGGGTPAPSPKPEAPKPEAPKEEAPKPSPPPPSDNPGVDTSDLPGFK
ncbi:MAG TPA: tetratricopeptide repeat protein [Polyangiaceae bacterium]|nr:tetratricopeptide repeat protein [Polyangiaceae bacterium]